MILKQTVRARRRQLEALADIWLADGATRFAAVAADGTVLFDWPKSAESPPTLQLSCPIQIRRNLLGCLKLAGLDDAASEKRLAAQAALIGQFVQLDLDLAEMTQEVVDRQDELVALQDLTESTRSKVELPALTRSVLKQLTQLFGCELGFAIVEFDQIFAEPIYQVPTTRLDAEIIRGWFSEVHASGDQLVVNRASTDIELPEHVENVLVAPLFIRGEILAAIGLVNKRGGDFTYPNRKLFTAVSQQFAAQIENALMYHESVHQAKLKHEYDLARDVQMQLLPNVAPQVVNIEVAATSKPAREVGGDLYNYLPSNEGELRFTVGDVSGKGMSAAMLMGMSHTMLRSAASFLDNPTPAAILDHANTALYDDFTEVSMFATVFVGQFDSKKRLITYANAGHSPVIYCGANDSAEMLEADGTAVGVLPWCLSEDHYVPLGVGDVLVVASDGFPEAVDVDGEMFGYERLLQLVEDNRTESAESLLQILTTAIADFSSGAEQADDETVMVLKGVR